LSLVSERVGVERTIGGLEGWGWKTVPLEINAECGAWDGQWDTEESNIERLLYADFKKI